jgi:ABC-type branched-subunit amino acid transport system substrate-binding protein
VRYRVIAIVACLAVVAAACGRSGGSGADASSSTTASTSPSTKSATFGTVRDVCGRGTPSGLPDQGVSPTEIRIATFSDSGFAGRPGLNQEFFDTADVFAAWCNARGGINGRKIVVDRRDAALTNVKARMTESCAEDFMMVGGGAVFDQDGVETRLKCLLPDVAGFVVSTPARGADLLVQPVPNSIKSLQIGTMRYLGKQFPDATGKAGVLTGDLSTTKTVADQNVEGAKSLGWKFVYNDQYPAAGLADWTPYAQKIKDAGTKGLIWIGDPDGLAPLLHALKDIGYRLDFIRADANQYDRKLIDQASDALSDDNVYIQSSFFPFEDAKPTNATGQYLQAFKDYEPNGKSRTYLGLQAWSAWMLFSKAAMSCGNDLTRRCVYDAARKISDWTGGGLHAPTNPASGTSTACNVVEQATPNGFRLAPKQQPNNGIFTCDPKSVYTLQGDYGKGVTLADVGQSIANLK